MPRPAANEPGPRRSDPAGAVLLRLDSSPLRPSTTATETPSAMVLTGHLAPAHTGSICPSLGDDYANRRTCNSSQDLDWPPVADRSRCAASRPVARRICAAIPRTSPSQPRESGRTSAMATNCETYCSATHIGSQCNPPPCRAIGQNPSGAVCADTLPPTPDRVISTTSRPHPVNVLLPGVRRE